jgi:hypothetical protein
MALVWLLGAGLAAVIGGFLQSRQTVLSFYLGLPFALAGVVGTAIATVWPGRSGRVSSAVRTTLGLVVGVLGAIAGFGYGDNHQAWFGERTTAVVAETRDGCSVESGQCFTERRVTDANTGEDLGWATLCPRQGRVGDRVEVDVDPLRWVPAQSPACTTPRRSAEVLLRLWLGGYAVSLVVVLATTLLGLRNPAAAPPAGDEPDHFVE